MYFLSVIDILNLLSGSLILQIKKKQHQLCTDVSTGHLKPANVNAPDLVILSMYYNPSQLL
jgi:hypothetical protein